MCPRPYPFPCSVRIPPYRRGFVPAPRGDGLCRHRWRAIAYAVPAPGSRIDAGAVLSAGAPFRCLFSMQCRSSGAVPAPSAGALFLTRRSGSGAVAKRTPSRPRVDATPLRGLLLAATTRLNRRRLLVDFRATLVGVTRPIASAPHFGACEAIAPWSDLRSSVSAALPRPGTGCGLDPRAWAVRGELAANLWPDGGAWSGFRLSFGPSRVVRRLGQSA